MAFTGDCAADPRLRAAPTSSRATRARSTARCTSRSSRCPTTACSIRRTTIAASPRPASREERRFNPRLGGEIGEGDFVGYMKNLGLPHPKQIDDRGAGQPALRPAGQRGGDAPHDPDWAPLRFTFAGVWEIEPHWLEEHARATVQRARRARARRIRRPARPHPRRDPDPARRACGAGRASCRRTAVVAVCRAGRRSAQATVMLQQGGLRARSPTSPAACCAGAARAAASRATRSRLRDILSRDARRTSCRFSTESRAIPAS